MWITGYEWILPAVTTCAWTLSWWGPRWIRWGLVPAAAVVSVLCLANGILTKGPPFTPQNAGCPSPMACMDTRPIPWIVAGLFGLAYCVALLVLTALVESAVWIVRRALAQSAGPSGARFESPPE